MARNKILTACAVAVLTTALYGCSSSDDGPSQAELDAAEAARAAAEAAAAAAEEAAEEAAEQAMEAEEDAEAAREAAEAQAAMDLENTQADAAMAAADAMTASTEAMASAMSAADATATLATLQTGADSNSSEKGGNEHADEAQYHAMAAADAAADAAAASAAAAAATTGADAEAAWRMAESAKDEAEKQAMSAAAHAALAIEAAMTELHIDGAMKSVGDSSVVATTGRLSTPNEDPTKPNIATGLQYNLMREMSGEVEGQAHSLPGTAPADVEPYKQAVAARNLPIGKVLDTMDDAARLVVIDSRASTKKVRVFAEEDGAAPGVDFAIRTDEDGLTAQGTVGADEAGDFTAITNGVPTNATTTSTTKLTSVGMYYEVETDANATPATDTNNENGAVANALDFTDTLGADTDPVEVFTYVDPNGPNGTAGDADDAPFNRYVVKTRTNTSVDPAYTDVSYQHVDVLARAAPDGTDTDGFLDEVGVTADLPVKSKYSHIHFGVWASLGDIEEDGSQKLSDLGIGWVQNFSDSGVTARLGIGTVTFNGDWIAVIQRQNSTGEGVFNIRDGQAEVTADFEKDEFEANLMGLAMLEGELDGNGFSGMTATQISHADLDGTGTFEGEFSGNIYGPRGTEAAGVFDFAGGAAGSFRGAFGGTNQD